MTEIVYIEDNSSNIAFMRAFVEDLPNVKLTVAPNAEIGLEIIRALRPAVIILDINLPGINGFEAVKQLRMWAETRDIPVIALSAMLPDPDRVRDSNFHRYLTKPVKLDELTSVLEPFLIPSPLSVSRHL